MFKTIQTIVMAALCLNLTAAGQLPSKLPLKNQAILGKVISASTGEALPGALIKTSANNQTVLSNDRGEFMVNLANGSYSLSVSYLSYKSKTIDIQVPLTDTLIIKLEADNTNLNEVEINAGYYTVKDKERTGSISRITSETIAKQPVTNLLQALQGTMSGIQIQQTSGVAGANINVQIRGKSSIDAGNNPFYIIDGVPFSSQSLSSIQTSDALFGSAGSSPFNTLNPADIESIEVLKDADATAIYGSRGANGVVLITTKKGKAGATQISANVNTGISNVGKKVKLLNTETYQAMRNEAFANDNQSPTATDYDVNGTWDKNRYTDWQKELIGGNARYNNAQLSLTGGNSNTQFLLSGNYLRQTTVFPGDFYYKRYATHFSANHTGKDGKLKASITSTYSTDENMIFSDDLTSLAIMLPPNAPMLYNTDGSLNWENSTWINPLQARERNFKAQGSLLTTNMNISYEPVKGLFLKTSFGFNDNRLNDRNITPSSYYDPAEHRTSASTVSKFNVTSMKSWIAEPQINWTKAIGAGTFNLIVGATFQTQSREQQTLTGTGFPADHLADDLNSAGKLTLTGLNNSTYKYSAIFSRLNYNFKEKYIFNLTGRRDGSSRFGPGRQFANFGALGAAWLFQEESLFKSLTFISFGKLRLSYGLSGNDQIGDYEYLDTYRSTIGYANVKGLSPNRLFNPDFAWEKNRKFEIGLDLGFFANRVYLTAGYYQNKSSNQLLKYPLALTTGFASVRNNLNATVLNKGFELELRTTNLRNNVFNWSSSFNITIPKNKLVSFPGLAGSSYASKYVVGRPLNIRKLYSSKGINKETGVWEFQDVNGDQLITRSADQKVFEVMGQRFYGGLTNEVNYKSFQFSFLLQFVKQKSLDFISYWNTTFGKMYNMPQSAYDGRWINNDSNAEVQRLTTGANAKVASAYNTFIDSDRSITDASFIRLKNIQLAYSLNKLPGNTSARLYLQGQNIYTLTKYIGLDPEIIGMGLPPLRTVTIGAQFTF
ncbi:SusC/RagA family TonB-linked outer membrane protein [Pedobacter nyackensis]|uniref:SusC/RagA family TonB-linked outer membrane protein n=1 Tax=Pedobacter nyackensis TaxID=475255 RepID=UPI00293137E7|nr:SusC/RagA family TonB-linked outer membrane protein [Pedobacter nyackensis]